MSSTKLLIQRDLISQNSDLRGFKHERCEQFEDLTKKYIGSYRGMENNWGYNPANYGKHGSRESVSIYTLTEVESHSNCARLKLIFVVFISNFSILGVENPLTPS